MLLNNSFILRFHYLDYQCGKFSIVFHLLHHFHHSTLHLWTKKSQRLYFFEIQICMDRNPSVWNRDTLPVPAQSPTHKTEWTHLFGSWCGHWWALRLYMEDPDEQNSYIPFCPPIKVRSFQSSSWFWCCFTSQIGKGLLQFLIGLTNKLFTLFQCSLTMWFFDMCCKWSSGKLYRGCLIKCTKELWHLIGILILHLLLILGKLVCLIL